MTPSPPPQLHRRDVDNSLPPGTIVGIVIGVVLIFALAALLFIIYYRREASMNELDDVSTNSASAGRRECRERGTGGESQLFGSSGDYYDLVNRHALQVPLNPDNAMPTHPAYIPTTSWPVIRPPPEPPSSVPVRSNRPDSYAIRTYIAAAQESAKLAAPSPAVGTNAGRPASRPFAIPLASLPRLPMPRKQTRAETEPHERLRHYSPPVTEWRSGSRQQNHRDNDDNFFEVPLRSGKSTLYGY
ncbi:hypothetical protein CP533_2625 [Ophiocordyceps camponoti-saundersi (nom. inval.)]|nr:hypothetical protein CP533_2625 [Ophiocordyceps camponoti-saundersi (nom. inval.)]